MEISVVYGTYPAPEWVQIEVEPDCLLQDAVAASGFLKKYPEMDLTKLRVGIFGKLAKIDSPLQPGDRVEIYHPIIRDLDEDDDDDF